VRMVPDTAVIDGRRFRYAVSSNAFGPEAKSMIWAVNIHGYFAGGEMYWRESARLANNLNIKILNPSLPGFGGSDPLAWNRLSMKAMGEKIFQLMDELNIGRALLIGHSMGGAIAVQMAVDEPDRVTGLIYRDGAATPSWKYRDGALAKTLSPIAPDLGSLLDLALAAMFDAPDLIVSKINSTIKSVIPDVRRNVKTIGATVPVAAMLFSTDLTGEVALLAGRREIPLLAEWGSSDLITPAKTAEEFESVSGQEIFWVPGGHSWMLARPTTQSWILKYHERGQRFLNSVKQRDSELSGKNVFLKQVL
jgi:pimeloyl-ACP methyl ester carboxylesterase